MEYRENKYIAISERSIQDYSNLIGSLGYRGHFKIDHTGFHESLGGCLLQHFEMARKQEVLQFPVSVRNCLNYSGKPGQSYQAVNFVFEWNEDIELHLDKMTLRLISEPRGYTLAKLDLHVLTDSQIPTPEKASELLETYYQLISPRIGKVESVQQRPKKDGPKQLFR